MVLWASLPFVFYYSVNVEWRTNMIDQKETRVLFVSFSHLCRTGSHGGVTDGVPDDSVDNTQACFIRETDQCQHHTYTCSNIHTTLTFMANFMALSFQLIIICLDVRHFLSLVATGLTLLFPKWPMNSVFKPIKLVNVLHIDRWPWQARS